MANLESHDIIKLRMICRNSQEYISNAQKINEEADLLLKDSYDKSPEKLIQLSSKLALLHETQEEIISLDKYSSRFNVGEKSAYEKRQDDFKDLVECIDGTETLIIGRINDIVQQDEIELIL